MIYVKEKKIHVILYLKLFYSLPETFCLSFSLFSTISNLHLYLILLNLLKTLTDYFPKSKDYIVLV